MIQKASIGLAGALGNPFWSDLQGMARITMVAGEATLTSIFVQQMVGDTTFSDTFIVPEPTGAALSLLGVALCVRFKGLGRGGRHNSAFPTRR